MKTTLFIPHIVYTQKAIILWKKGTFFSVWDVISKESKALCVLVQRVLLEEELAQSWGMGSNGRADGTVVLGGNRKNK